MVVSLPPNSFICAERTGLCHEENIIPLNRWSIEQEMGDVLICTMGGNASAHHYFQIFQWRIQDFLQDGRREEMGGMGVVTPDAAAF